MLFIRIRGFIGTRFMGMSWQQSNEFIHYELIDLKWIYHANDVISYKILHFIDT